jgi:hypothetical protein
MMMSDANQDDVLISACPATSKVELVYVSMVKRLLAGELPANFRLRFLQWLDERDRQSEEWRNLRITSGMIAAIEPMCERAHGALMGEITKLGKFDRISAIGREDVFSAFVALNPSLLTAIRMGQTERRAS